MQLFIQYIPENTLQEQEAAGTPPAKLLKWSLVVLITSHDLRK